MKNKSVDTSIKLGNKSLYVNKKEADKIVSSITKELGNVSKSLSSIGGILNKLQYKKLVKGNLGSTAKKCTSQGQYAENSVSTIENSYNNDLKDYAIDLLNQRISALEEQISKM